MLDLKQLRKQCQRRPLCSCWIRELCFNLRATFLRTSSLALFSGSGTRLTWEGQAEGQAGRGGGQAGAAGSSDRRRESRASRGFTLLPGHGEPRAAVTPMRFTSRQEQGWEATFAARVKLPTSWLSARREAGRGCLTRSPAAECPGSGCCCSRSSRTRCSPASARFADLFFKDPSKNDEGNILFSPAGISTTIGMLPPDPRSRHPGAGGSAGFPSLSSRRLSLGSTLALPSKPALLDPQPRKDSIYLNGAISGLSAKSFPFQYHHVFCT